MKGLILAAGLGTRLRPLTSLRPKPLVSVANKALIFYAIDDLVNAGIIDIGIVVSPLTKPYLKEALGEYDKASFSYIVQNPPEGIAHAVKTARDFLEDSPFVLYLSDNLFEYGVKDFVERYNADNTNAVLALVRVEDPRALGVAVVEDGQITMLVEKPEVPPSNLAIAGVYVLDKSIHDVIETLPRGAKNEYQITDAIQALIDKGGMVAPQEVSGWWKDTGKPADILDANRLMLLKVQAENKGMVENSNIVGDVSIGKGTVVKNSTIVGPAMIASDVYIDNAYIGPFSSIGKGAVINDAEVEYTVMEEKSKLLGIKTRIQASLIGVDVEVSSRDIRPKTHQLILGDKSIAYLNE